MSETMIGKLFAAYWNARFFLICHAGVLVLVLLSLRRLYQEIHAVRQWSPERAGVGDGTDVTTLLDSFSTQAESLGKRGIFLPLTDYSDRIDAIVSGRISSLHDRIHMFLLVGIAGTLTGLFQFAASSRSALAAHTVGTSLADAMASAFPVGVLGLAMMMLFLYAAVFPEDHLHKEVAGATRRALDYRGNVTGTTSDRVETLAITVKDALAPLATLQSTLNESLVSAFGDVLQNLTSTLERQIEVVNSHVATLESETTDFKAATRALVGATRELTTPVKDMTKAVKHLPKLLEKTEEIQKDLLLRGEQIQTRLLERGDQIQRNLQAQSERVQEGYQALLEKTVTIYDGAARTFEETINTAAGVKNGLAELHDQLGNLPDAIVQGSVDGARESFKEVGLQSAEFWKRSFDQLRQDVHGELVTYVSVLRDAANEVHQKLHLASDEMQRLATNSNEVVVAPVQKIVEHGKGQILTVLDRVADLVEQAAPAADRLAELARVARETAALLAQQTPLQRIDEVSVVPSRNPDLDRLVRTLDKLVLRSVETNEPTPTTAATVGVRIRGAGQRLWALIRRRG